MSPYLRSQGIQTESPVISVTELSFVPHISLRQSRLNSMPGADSTKGVPGAPPPFKIFKDQGTRVYIYIYIMTFVHISRSILMSQFISDLISIMQTLFGNSHKPQLKRSKIFCISRLLNLPESLRACTLTFFTQ